MKTALVISAAAVVGVVLGVGSALLRARNVPLPAGPKVVADAEGFDFGTMDCSQDGSHDFKFTNHGTSPLVLTPGATSCSCTLGEIKEPILAPEQSTLVHVTWKSKQHKYVGRFKQNVTINTNDPAHAQVVLSITGEYTEPLHREPDDLDFGQITGNQPVIRKARIFCKLPEHPLEIASHDFADHDLAKFFQVEIRPLAPEEVHEKAGAKSGVMVTVTAKPGLPPGRFQQTIVMRTNIPAVSEVELPLFGSQGKEVSIVGSGWDDDIGVLNLGTVPAGSGAQRQLQIFARGAEAKDVRYNVVHVDPAFLKVKLGDTELTEEGKLSRTPLTIEIPPQAGPCTFMGGDRGKFGEIHIDTTSNAVHQLRVRLRFAIEKH